MWTTTPWTLPANVAVAVHPGARYALVRTPAGDVWVAEARAGHLPVSRRSRRLRDRGRPGLAGPTTRRCRTCRSSARTAHRVVAWDGVSLEEGTGLVHIAPGCGAEDFELGRALGLPVLAPIDEDGRYTGGYGWLSGRHVTGVDAGDHRPLAAAGYLLHERQSAAPVPAMLALRHAAGAPRGGRVVPGLRRDQGAHAGRGRDRRLASRALRPAHGRLARPHGRLVHQPQAVLGPAAAVLPLPGRAPHRRGVQGRTCWPGRCRAAARCPSCTVPGSTRSG